MLLIKQHLKIKSFWGQNENAVRSQIWVAISTYIIVAIAKMKLDIPNSLSEFLQYISIAPIEKTPLTETFAEINLQERINLNCNQPNEAQRFCPVLIEKLYVIFLSDF